MYKLRSIASLQPNPRRLPQQKYYQKNTAKMRTSNSVRYRKQKTAEREIPDGLPSLAPILLPVTLPQAKWKAKEGAKKKAKADAALRAKKTVSKPRILYSVSKSKGRKRKSKSEPRDSL